jgi:type II secretory pathway pseudopilin PulG
LTLLELVVVLVILVALASILVPLLPRILGRAHSATGATNLTEINKIIHTYHATNLKYPEGLDNLVDTAGSDVHLAIPGRAALGTITLTAATAGQLHVAGIHEIYSMIDDPGAGDVWNATFWPYSNVAGRVRPAALDVVDDTPTVVTVPTIDVDAIYGENDEIATYVVFGLGDLCSAVGQQGLMVDAPVHFEPNAEGNTAETYQRFGLVFGLPTDTAEPAVFVGAVAFHHGGIAGPHDALESHFGDHNH